MTLQFQVPAPENGPGNNSDNINVDSNPSPNGSRLENYARRLAGEHSVDRVPLSATPSAGAQSTTYPTSHLPSLLNHLPKLAIRLRAAHRYFVNAPPEELALAYASEWLLDNFHLIEVTLRQIKDDLPAGYYRQLPKLSAAGPLQGYPRIYALVRGFLHYDEAQTDPERLQRFVDAYQQSSVLTMGELWALPIMLRWALLESIAQAAGQLTGQTLDSNQVPYTYQASDNELIANAIPSLRRVDSQDWNDFFEQVSRVQQILCRDPADIYARMDFATRNRYRSVIEQIARATGHAEALVAGWAVDHA
ncbi:MAG: hypothetical protein M3Q45_01290, partial [Chloroflexota bacterium]|nr:hypothetical protein [Chloroflexota bacterium]